MYGEGLRPTEVQMTPGGVTWQRHEVDGGALLVSPDCDDGLIERTLRTSVGDVSTLTPVPVQGKFSTTYHFGEDHVIKTGQHIYHTSPTSNDLNWGIWALRANVSLREGLVSIGADIEPTYKYENNTTGAPYDGYTFEGVRMLAAFLPDVMEDKYQPSPVWLMERAVGRPDRLVYPTNWPAARNIYAAACAAVGLERQIRLDHMGYNDIIDRRGPITRVTKIDSAARMPIEF